MKIAPSILSADFGRLNQEVAEVEPYCDCLHVDVMDGHFVPDITLGPAVVKAISTKLPIECHLMVTDPVRQARLFAPYCTRISFHAELFKAKDLLSAVEKIKKMGVEVGLTINPDKPVSLLEPALDKIDYVLIMSVFAGKPGQKFIPKVLEKVRRLRSIGFKKEIEIDGGINPKTIMPAYEAGADLFVAGSAIFGKKDRKEAISQLRRSVR